MTGVPPSGSRLVEARGRRLSAPSGQPPTPGIRARSASTPSAAVASFRARSQCAESRLRERARRDGLPGETVVHWRSELRAWRRPSRRYTRRSVGSRPGPNLTELRAATAFEATAPTREAMPSRRSAALAGGSARGATSAEVHRPAGVLGQSATLNRSSNMGWSAARVRAVLERVGGRVVAVDIGWRQPCRWRAASPGM